jgi:hypothetical protein
MSEILRDPGWQFLVGSLLAVVTIIVSVAVYMKQRQRKRLSYQIVSNTPLLSVEEEIKKDLVIQYKGKEVKEVDLLVVRIVNTGNIPIDKKDFDRPITLDLGEEAQILTAEISDKKPDELQPSINVEQSKVKLEPILLNQGDEITFKMLVAGLAKDIKFDLRIFGVKKIEQFSEDSIPGIVLGISGAILALGVSVIGAIGSQSILASQGLVVLLAGYGLLTGGMLLDKETRRRIRRAARILASRSVVIEIGKTSE